MNEFSLYENYYCNSYQSTDLLTPLHTIEHELSPTTQAQHYFNVLAADLPAQSQTQTTTTTNTFPLISSSHQSHAQQQQQQTQTHAMSLATCSTVDTLLNVRVANANTNAYNNIPFVQIHTTDVQPQGKRFGNVFRRTTNKLEEIKSEPIKSESADNTKERVNNTPTPPVRTASCNSTTGERIGTPTSSNTTQTRATVTATTTVPDNSIAAFTDSSSATQFISLSSLQKCTQCAFLALNATDLELHVSAVHANNIYDNTDTYRTQLICPGCNNTFYTQNVLQLHLQADHLMAVQSATAVIAAMLKETQTPTTPTATVTVTNESNNNNKQMFSPKETQRKSRIYLKNVDCLRDPNRENIAQQENQITENFYSGNDWTTTSLLPLNNESTSAGVGVAAASALDEAAILELLDTEQFERCNNDNNINNNAKTTNNKDQLPSSVRKQKISIKSVDVLREPAFLRRDYEQQQQQQQQQVANFNSYNNNNNSSNDIANQFNAEHNADPPNRTDASFTHSFDEHMEKPRRPKIYIRNVDILKEPMLMPTNLVTSGSLSESNGINFNYACHTQPQSATQYSNGGEDLEAPTQVYDTNLSQLPIEPYLYEQTNSNFLPVATELENFAFLSNSSGGNNFLHDNTRYTHEMTFSLEPTHTINSTPIMTEPTPSPPPPPTTVPLEVSVHTVDAENVTTIQRQKIFIKNVDVLKAPQFQEPRGTLHLRTVDELNLMNKNEVENLIAPNLDNNTGGGCTSTTDAGIGVDTTYVQDVSHTELPDELLYGDEDCFKLHDFDAQVVNNWTDDYDLSEDLDCIITSNTTLCQTAVLSGLEEASTKLMHELDTPQMSLISIRDIDELTQPTTQNTNNNSNSSSDLPTVLTSIADITPVTTTTINSQRKPNGNNAQTAVATPTTVEVPKQERLNNNHIFASKIAVSYADVPPLVPMTNSTVEMCATAAGTRTESATRINTSNIPVPPLVPVSPLIQLSRGAIVTNTVSNATSTAPLSSTGSFTKAAATVSTTQTSGEKARIYVANNLMQTSAEQTVAGASKRLDLPVTSGGTSVRGRPYGAKRIGKPKRVKDVKENTSEIGLKCSMTGCVFRFKKTETLEYHKLCHNSDNASGSQSIIRCPECKSTDYNNWNTLHTHLWRSHQVDMELYSCDLCSFKTPVYSRLINTHAKIHSEERNYKCEQCDKAFKNTKQLKNHRRWHRNHAIGTAAPASSTTDGNTDNLATDTGTPTAAPAELHRCNDCEAVFSHLKSLREHSCKRSQSPVKCTVCGRIASSKSSLKLHMLTHETTKRFKCTHCAYSGNDHNAFRRHKMIHENAKTYVCPHCPYKSIQSVAYQKHVQQKHPDDAAGIIHKCTLCAYSTINRALYAVHQAKHEVNKKTSTTTNEFAVNKTAQDNDEKESRQCNKATTTIEPTPKQKIKVKSNLLLTQMNVENFNDVDLEDISNEAVLTVVSAAAT